MADKTLLFTGESNPLGGLSNEKELAKLCPDEFKDWSNPWSSYVRNLFFDGGDMTKWKWKSTSKKEREKQVNCLVGILGTLDLLEEDKDAVAGWMLSEMLVEVPMEVKVLSKIKLEFIGFGKSGPGKVVIEAVRELFENEPFSGDIWTIINPVSAEGKNVYAFVRVYDVDGLRGRNIAQKINDRTGFHVEFIRPDESFERFT